MQKSHVRHMFPGANSAYGFFSCYDYIINKEDANRVFILKGGPGTGKSTLMKKLAGELLKQGCNIDFMHCSSDPSSLDGIVIPQAKAAVIDGTAPHVVDPVLPGAVDEIVNLGEFWNESSFKAHRNEIISLVNQKKAVYASVYKYLHAACYVMNDTIELNSGIRDMGQISKIAAELSQKLTSAGPSREITASAGLSPERQFPERQFPYGRQRRLFAKVITPEGSTDYLDSLITQRSVYIINSSPGAGADEILNRLDTSARSAGFNTECFFNCLNPAVMEHLIIPELDMAFTSYNDFKGKPVETIELDKYLNTGIYADYSGIISFNSHIYEELINRSVELLSKAGKVHSKIEEYYVPNMNFAEIDKAREAILARIREYLQETLS